MSQHPAVVAESDGFEELAALAVRECMARHEDLNDETWSAIGLVCATLIRDTNGGLGRRREDEPFPAAARHRLARETLLAPNEPPSTWELRTSGILGEEDFEYWLREYGRVHGTGDDLESIAEAAAAELARPDHETRAVAQQVAAEEPVLSEFVTEWFSDARVEQYERHRRTQQERDAQQSNARDNELFSLERASAALDEGAWPALLCELEQPTVDDRSERKTYVRGAPVSQRQSWTLLATSQAAAATTLADKFLTEPPAGITHELADAAAGAYTLLREVDAEILAAAPTTALKAWFPLVAELSGRSDTASAMLERIAIDDSDWIDSWLLDRLAAEAPGEYLFVTDRMGTYTSAKVEEALLEHAGNSDIRPNVLRPLLAAALERVPNAAASLAMTIARQRPDSRPIVDSTAPGDLDEPDHAAWRRAVAAAAALATSGALRASFDQLLSEFQADSEFAQDVIRSTGRHGAFATLTPEQAASLYLWARMNLPDDRWAAPGVAITVDPVKEFAGDLLRRLQANPTEADAEALDTIGRMVRRQRMGPGRPQADKVEAPHSRRPPTERPQSGGIARRRGNRCPMPARRPDARTSRRSRPHRRGSRGHNRPRKQRGEN